MISIGPGSTGAPLANLTPTSRHLISTQGRPTSAIFFNTTCRMPREAAGEALKEAKRVARRVVATVWAPPKWRGREVGRGVWEVPWGDRAVRVYFQYELGDLAEVAPSPPLSMGILRRGRQYNFYILL